MEHQKHERFLSANNELRGFLRRAEGVANGTCTISDAEFRTLTRRLSNCGFSVGEASRSETLDPELRSEIGEYVRNLRATQRAVERVRDITLAQRMRLETTQPHFVELNGWANLYPPFE